MSVRSPLRAALAALAAASLLVAPAALLAPAAAAPSAPGAEPATARATPPVALRVVTANLAFRGNAAVRKDWRTFGSKADVVLVQEAKNVNLDKILGPQWVVRQDRSSSAAQGSAVVVRSSVAASVGKLLLRLGTPAASCGPDGDGGIQARYLAQVRITLTNGARLRTVALHMPPGRCQDGTGGPYHVMAGSVVDAVRANDTLTVLGADWNKTVDADPNGIGAKTGLVPLGPNAGKRIDGFYVSPQIAATEPRHLARTGSDHRPVKTTVTVPGV